LTPFQAGEKAVTQIRTKVDELYDGVKKASTDIAPTTDVFI